MKYILPTALLLTIVIAGCNGLWFPNNFFIRQIRALIRSLCPDMDVSSNSLSVLQALLVSCRTRPTTTTQATTTAATFKDCQDYYLDGQTTSGVYQIVASGVSMAVWCDFFDGHGWTMIHRRGSGNLDFERSWAEYKNGFGDNSNWGEHWLGNDNIHALTQTNQKLNIKLASSAEEIKQGTWTQFFIAGESDKYRLTISGTGYSGSLEDKFSPAHNGMQFTTTDNDNDGFTDGNCANSFSGGWWYDSCYAVNLNGKYGSGGTNFMWLGFINSPSPAPLSMMMRVTRD